VSTVISEKGPVATAPADDGTGRAGSTTGRRRRRRPGRVLLSLAALWLAYVVTHLFLTGEVWWWAALGSLPPLLFLVVPALLLGSAPLARPQRWRVALIGMATLALGAGQSGVNPAALWHHPAPVPASAVTVLSWNTDFWDQRDRPDEFYRYLRSFDADVYLLQEYLFVVDDQPVRVDELARLRTEFPGYQVVVAGELITLSRLPVVSWSPLDASAGLSEQDGTASPPGTDFRAYYTTKTLRTDIRIGTTTVSFYNVHIPLHLTPDLSPFGSAFYRFLREQHAKRDVHLAALHHELSTHDGTAVVAGDFNTSPAMGELADLPDRLADATPAMTDLYPVSWRQPSPAWWRVDWVFTTTDIGVHRYEFRPSEGMSDHSAQLLLLSPPH